MKKIKCVNLKISTIGNSICTLMINNKKFMNQDLKDQAKIELCLKSILGNQIEFENFLCCSPMILNPRKIAWLSIFNIVAQFERIDNVLKDLAFNAAVYKRIYYIINWFNDEIQPIQIESKSYRYTGLQDV